MVVIVPLLDGELRCHAQSIARNRIEFFRRYDFLLGMTMTTMSVMMLKNRPGCPSRRISPFHPGDKAQTMAAMMLPIATKCFDALQDETGCLGIVCAVAQSCSMCFLI